MTDVLVCDSEYDLSTQRRHVDALARKSIDGLVLSGLRRDEPYPALLEADFPLVQVYDRIEAYHTDFVGIDAEARRITGQLAARKVHAYSSGRAMSRVNSYMSWGKPTGSDSPAVIVTAYRPDPVLWMEDYLRRVE